MTPVLESDASQRSDVPIVIGGPESIFGVDMTALTQGRGKGSMTTGPWLRGLDGIVPVGAAGVLFDNVLGYSIITESASAHWSVSSEITVEIVGRMPTGSRQLHAEAEVVHADSISGLAEGRLLDDQGRVIARGSQRGRFIKNPGVDTTPAPADLRADASDLAGLVGIRKRNAGGALQVAIHVDRKVQNPLGNLHGGVSLCVSEYAALLALKESEGPPLTTASMHIVYARPIASGAEVRYEAVVQRRSRSLAIVDVIGSVDGKACTFARITAQPQAPAEEGASWTSV